MPDEQQFMIAACLFGGPLLAVGLIILAAKFFGKWKARQVDKRMHAILNEGCDKETSTSKEREP